jgi:hypothetical protein
MLLYLNDFILEMAEAQQLQMHSGEQQSWSEWLLFSPD